MATAGTGEGWKAFGIVKGYGIPAPSGSHTVGCVDVMHNDLLVRLMYPTSPDSAGQFEYAKLLPHPKYVRAFLDYLRTKGAAIMSFVMRKLMDPRSPAFINAPLLPCTATPPESETPPASVAQVPVPDQFPIVIFSHGLGANRTLYSSICSDMVSHGYVVAAIEHHDRSAALSFRRVPGPGVEEGQYDQYTEEWIEHEFGSTTDFELRNPQLLQRSREVSQTLDLLQLLNSGGEVHNKMGGNFDFSAFNGRLDLDKAAVVGHSFGGATTVQVLHDDTRFKCGIGLDTWMFPVHADVYRAGIGQPLIFINSFDFQWKENVASMMEVLNESNRQDPSKCSLLTLKGTHHTNQSDAVFVGFKFAAKNSALDRYLAHSLNMDLCHAFLKRHLHKDPTYQGTVPNLDGGEGANENILFGTNIEWNTHDAEQLAPANGQSCDSQVIDNTPVTTPKNEDLHENEGIKELHDMAHQDKSTAITEFDS